MTMRRDDTYKLLSEEGDEEDESGCALVNNGYCRCYKEISAGATTAHPWNATGISFKC